MSSKKLRCSFCGKNQDEVKNLVAAPGVCICDECALLCMKAIIGNNHENSKEQKNIELKYEQCLFSLEIISKANENIDSGAFALNMLEVYGRSK